MPGNLKTTNPEDCQNHIDYWAAFISIALIVVFGITLFTTYFFPIYPDEIQARFWLSRLPYDFPEKISGAPRCLSTFFQPIPITMYVPGLINWATHGRIENVYGLRGVGVAIAFMWLTGITLYLYAKTKNNLVYVKCKLKNRYHGLHVAGIVIALFSVGVFPFFLITNRGEQLILPSVVILLTISIASEHLEFKDQKRRKLGLVVLYFVAVSLALYGHPKGLFLTPFYLTVGWQLFRKFNSLFPFVLAMALISLHIQQDIVAYKYAFQCNEFPQFEGMLKSFSFDPASLFYDPRNFFDQAYHSWIRFPKYLHQLGFKEQTDIAYLPNLHLATSAKVVNFFIKLNFAAIFFTLLIFLPFQYYRKDLVANRFTSVNLALLVLFACALISAIFNLPKNWYDAGYLYALLMIITVFFVGENFGGIFQKVVAKRIFLYLGVVALLSQVILIQRYYPPFINGYVGPGISIANYDSNKARADLEAISRTCKIDPVVSQRVVVDDYTYLYFQKSKWPMAFTYIWMDSEDQSIRRFFSHVDSDGLAVRCNTMLEPYMAYVKREGDLCCITKSGLKSLSLLPE